MHFDLERGNVNVPLTAKERGIETILLRIWTRVATCPYTPPESRVKTLALVSGELAKLQGAQAPESPA